MKASFFNNFIISITISIVFSCFDPFLHRKYLIIISSIEHLTSDVLDEAVSMVFGKIQPRIVVMTTPNADFNILFPGFSGVRHWDHKFEWTQKEFQEWWVLRLIKGHFLSILNIVLSDSRKQ